MLGGFLWAIGMCFRRIMVTCTLSTACREDGTSEPKDLIVSLPVKVTL